MSVSIKDFGLDRLSLADRIVLVEELWDSIAASPDAVALTAEQARDLERRLDCYRDDPKVGSPWEEVRARLREKTP